MEGKGIMGEGGSIQDHNLDVCNLTCSGLLVHISFLETHFTVLHFSKCDFGDHGIWNNDQV